MFCCLQDTVVPLHLLFNSISLESTSTTLFAACGLHGLGAGSHDGGKYSMVCFEVLGIGQWRGRQTREGARDEARSDVQTCTPGQQIE